MLVKKPERKPIPEDLMVKLIERYEDGASMKSLAEEAGCARQTLTEKMRRRGVQIRGRGRPKGSTKKKEEAPATVPPPAPVVVASNFPDFSDAPEETEDKPKVLGRRIIDL